MPLTVVLLVPKEPLGVCQPVKCLTVASKGFDGLYDCSLDSLVPDHYIDPTRRCTTHPCLAYSFVDIYDACVVIQMGWSLRMITAYRFESLDSNLKLFTVDINDDLSAQRRSRRSNYHRRRENFSRVYIILLLLRTRSLETQVKSLLSFANSSKESCQSSLPQVTSWRMHNQPWNALNSCLSTQCHWFDMAGYAWSINDYRPLLIFSLLFLYTQDAVCRCMSCVNTGRSHMHTSTVLSWCRVIDEYISLLY